MPVSATDRLSADLWTGRVAVTTRTLNKRLDILERLNKLYTQFTEGPIRPFLDTEIEHCRTFLHQSPTLIPHVAELAVATPQSRWARFFLTQPALCLRKRIFKGLFYFFFVIAMLAFPIAPTALLSDSPADIVSFIAFYFVFYFGVALLFRYAAR
jgi:hypothetical protein